MGLVIHGFGIRGLTIRGPENSVKPQIMREISQIHALNMSFGIRGSHFFRNSRIAKETCTVVNGTKCDKSKKTASS